MCKPEDARECKVVIVKRGDIDCCDSDLLHSHRAVSRHDASCCCGPSIQRHFVSSTEKIESLEKYRTDLEKELEGVTEAIEKSKSD